MAFEATHGNESIENVSVAYEENGNTIRTLGSETPRVCTRITRCMNFTAQTLTPALASGAQTKPNMRDFTLDSVVHTGGLFFVIHLNGKLDKTVPRTKSVYHSQMAEQKGVHGAKTLDGQLDESWTVVVN